MALREFLRSNWHLLTIAVTAGVIVCAPVFLLSTMPPHSIAMATGPEGGGYYEIGRQYQELLARSGVELRLVTTAGSLENLALLGELRFLEDEITDGGSTDRAQLTARLDRLEKQASQLRMPIVYESMMYLLRHHISYCAQPPHNGSADSLMSVSGG